MTESIKEYWQKGWRFLFPEYQCPACGGKLYKICVAKNLDEILTWSALDILATIIFLLLDKLFGHLFFILVLVIVIVFYDRIFTCDRSNQGYGCESCDQEFTQLELENLKGKSG